MAGSQESNFVTLHFAEEESPKVVSESANWYPVEVNSYSDFGLNTQKKSREPINAGRQNKKGTIVGIQANAGFSVDFMFSNCQRLFQGFMFANMREKPTSKPMNSTQILISGVTASTDTYSATTGFSSFKAGHLIFAKGFSKAQNNGLKLVSSATASTVVVGDGLADETPTSNASIAVVGFKAASGDLTLTANSSYVELASTVLDFSTLTLIPGEWVFLGGDSPDSKFSTANSGYCRIKSVTAHSIIFDAVRFVAETSTGTGKTIEIYFGNVIKNENSCENIIKRSYQLERAMECSGSARQSEYLIGQFCNELKINFPEKDLITADFGFIGLDAEHRTAVEGLKTGTRMPVVMEDAMSTTNDLYSVRMGVVTGTVNPTALFAYVKSADITIANGITVNPALGITGGFDVSTGNFNVSGSLTVYFTDVEAISAIRANSDVSFEAIITKNNQGVIMDMPLVGISDGKLNVEKNASITLPLTNTAYENDKGYTLLCNWFAYLPGSAMAD